MNDLLIYCICFCFYSFVRQSELNLLNSGLQVLFSELGMDTAFVGGTILCSSCGVKASAAGFE